MYFCAIISNAVKDVCNFNVQVLEIFTYINLLSMTCLTNISLVNIV